MKKIKLRTNSGNRVQFQITADNLKIDTVTGEELVVGRYDIPGAEINEYPATFIQSRMIKAGDTVDSETTVDSWLAGLEEEEA